MPWCRVHADCMMASSRGPADPATNPPKPAAEGDWDWCDAWTPPRCPKDLPEDALYWDQKEKVDPTHNVCRYSGKCDLVLTNRERHQSIRDTLRATRDFFNAL